MFKKYVLAIFLCLVSSSSFAADSTSFNPVTMSVTPTVTPQPAPPIQGETCNWAGWRYAVNAAYVGGTFVCDAWSSSFARYCSGGIITTTHAVDVCSSSHDTAVAPPSGPACGWAGWSFPAPLVCGSGYVCEMQAYRTNLYCSGGKATSVSQELVCTKCAYTGGN